MAGQLANASALHGNIPTIRNSFGSFSVRSPTGETEGERVENQKYPEHTQVRFAPVIEQRFMPGPTYRKLSLKVVMESR